MDWNRGMGWGKRAEAATVYLATNQTKRDREREGEKLEATKRGQRNLLQLSVINSGFIQIK